MLQEFRDESLESRCQLPSSG